MAQVFGDGFQSHTRERFSLIPGKQKTTKRAVFWCFERVSVASDDVSCEDLQEKLRGVCVERLAKNQHEAMDSVPGIVLELFCTVTTCIFGLLHPENIFIHTPHC